jgi:hypothetical protein
VAERLGFDSLENKLGIPREESNWNNQGLL